ncbi:protein Sur7p [[Candida] railenensis]|uniref:Protein Sur7p n=1 Tax=[Candida] railenensis TaxID=45579 RepID=A0A9P0QNX4_9ASCO|nr:protein Sur7p [[Candida] railenensis]
MKLILTILNLFFLAGSCLLLIFTVLSGTADTSPINKFYWLEADTSKIPGAPSTAAWTFWGVCDRYDFGNCTLGPAYPISPPDNFHTDTNVPKDFISNRDMYYYLTKFSFGFTFVALCFAGVAFIIGILGLCFSIIDKVLVAFVSIALFFVAGTASFQTAATVLAKQAFNDSDLSAKLGVKAFAILWTTVACLLISFFLTCFGNIASSYRKHMDRVYAAKQPDGGYNDSGIPPPVVGDGIDNDVSSFTRAEPAQETKEDNGGGVRFFKIKRNPKVSDEESV